MLANLLFLLSALFFPQAIKGHDVVAPIPCPLSPAPLCLKVVVAEDGIYRIAPADLEAAGWEVAALDPRTFGLSSQGQPVAIRVAGEADGSFDSGDFIEFYGQRFRGDEMAEKYTDDNVYWLAAGGEAGPRMAELNVRPAGAPYAPTSFWTTHRAEENNYWFTHHALDWPTRDTWWWERMTVRDVGHFPLSTVLPAPADEVYTATLSIELGTRRQVGTHHVQASWQGLADPVLDVLFDGHQLYRTQADLPGDALIDGTNVLTITVLNDQKAMTLPKQSGNLADMLLPASPDMVAANVKPDYSVDDLYVNYYELRYRRRYEATDGRLRFTSDVTGTHAFRLSGFGSPDLLLYDISDPLQPHWLSGFQVGLAGDGSRRLTAQLEVDAGSVFLALESGEVASPDQITAPQPATVRSTTNGADWIVITHPQFITEAQRLADYRAGHDNFRTAVVNVEELYEQFNDGIFNPEAIRRFIAYAVDNWQPPAPQYVLLIGDGNWNFKGYGQANYGPPDPNWIPPYLVWEDYWQGEVGSDNAYVALEPDNPLPSLAIGRLPARSAAEAAVMVDKIIAYEAQASLPFANWKRRVLFVADNADSTGDYPAVAEAVIADHLPVWLRPKRIYLGVTHSQPLSVTNAIIQNIDEGTSLISYLGHGSVDRWAHEEVWNVSQIAQLTNADRLPLVVTLNCLDGYFIHGMASLEAIAEEMLRYAGGGSIAAWSPAGLGTTTVENILHTALLDAILVEGQQRIGPATVRAKEVLYDTWGTDPLIHTMTLFGDPALKLSLPGWQQSLPFTARNGN